MLSTKLDEVLKSKQPLQEQMNEYFAFADQMAAKLGWVKPGALTPASENPQLSLEIARLHIEDARAQREHERQIEKDRREWDLKLIELKDKRELDKAKQEQDAKKTDMILTAPQTLGAAIAQGLIEHGRGGGAPAIPQTKLHTVSAGEGEAGQFYCPECETGVAIGPTTAAANCINCGASFKIERVPSTGPEPPKSKKGK
jgi:hypothetical protein